MLSFWGVEKLSGKTGNDLYMASSVSPHDSGEDRTLSSIYEKYRQTSKLLLPLGVGARTLTVRGLLQQTSIPRISKQRDSG